MSSLQPHIRSEERCLKKKAFAPELTPPDSSRRRRYWMQHMCACAFVRKKKMPKTANLSSTMFYNLHIGKGQCVDTQQQSLWREGTRCVRSWNRNTMITALKKKKWKVKEQSDFSTFLRPRNICHDTKKCLTSQATLSNATERVITYTTHSRRWNKPLEAK